MDAGSKDDDQITPVTSTALELAKADPSPEEAHPGAALITVSNAAIRDGSNVGLNTTSPDASLIAGEKLLVGQRDDVENDAEKQEGVQVSGEAGPKPEYISPVNGINGKPQPSVHDAMRSPEDMLNQNSGSLSAFGAKYLYPSRAPGDGVEHGTENHGQGKTIDHIGSRPEPSTPFPAIVSNASVRLPKRPVENGLPNNEEPNDRAGVGLVNIDDFEEPVHSDLDDDNSDSNSELEFKAMMRAKSEGIEDEDDENENEDDNVRRSARRSVPVRRWSSSEASASSDGGGDDDSDYAVDNDEDYASSRKKSRKRSSKTSRRGKNQSRDILDVAPRGEQNETVGSESSDEDWLDHDAGLSKKIRKRNKRKNRNKRRREIAVEGNTEPTRVSTRIGRQNVRYSEANLSDSDFLDSDYASGAQVAKDSDENENALSIERVFDFRAVHHDETPSESKPHSLADFDPDSVEFRVKWTNASYRRCSWLKLEDLRAYKGIQRVLNYVKILSDQQKHYNSPAATPEEREESIVFLQEHRANEATHEVIDRIIAERPVVDDPSLSEYLVKWKNLEYSECTWEPATELNSGADVKALDDFSEREQAPFSSKRKGVNPFNINDARPRFRRMIVQPKYLHGEERKLREYQLAGLNWLCYSWTKRNNVILADEMGLGKTLQTVSFLGWLMYAQKIQGPFLVVVPLSTSASWVREFQRWLPDVNVVNYVGDGASRAMIRQHEFWHSTGRENSVKFQVLLTTPELVMLDEEFIDEVRWAVLAVDEAHRLKNENSALHKTLKSFRTATRLLITGTPLQNSVRELWALLHFLNPEIFPDAGVFEERFSFSALRDPEKVSELHNTLRPYIIRRQKSDVEKSLPKKSYAVLRVGMSSAQQEYYKLLYTKNFAKLNAAVNGNSVGPTMTLRNLVMELKKCCNHPFLFPRFFQSNPHSTVQSYIRGSGKLILLDKLLLRLREKGHRVLIFSQMVSMLDILQEYCGMRGFPHQRLDGTMQNDIRQRSIDHYNAPGSTDFVFLLSTRAGGLGINLATADTVIIFDSDWNPQNDLQAESRAHRIGQKKDVKVFRFVTRDSVEEDILERAKRKRVLEHLVIHGVEGDEKQNGAGGKEKVAFKREELSAILRFGAEKLFEKDNPSDQPNEAVAPGVGSNGDSGSVSKPVGGNGSDGTVDDAKEEEKRVLAVDDIDELLARVPVDEADELGAAEPSAGDSLLNAFKWADFETIEEEEEEDIKDSEVPNKDTLALEAARGVAVIEDKRSKDIGKAKAADAMEKEMLENEGDVAFWSRMLPKNSQEEATEVVLGSRQRRRPKSFGADSPQIRKRSSTSRASARSRRAMMNGQNKAEGNLESVELEPKEERALLRSLRRFGNPKRVKVILRDAGLENLIDETTAREILEGVLKTAQAAVELHASKGQKQDDSTENTASGDVAMTDGNNAGTDESKSVAKALINVLSESNVDAADLMKRCDDLRLLGKQIGRFEEDIRFRLQRPAKAPSYGIRWMPQLDAMLLVGVYRHGFGNWSEIAEDAELRLTDKINVPGNSRFKEGAPDVSKLNRRVLTLLKELEVQARPAARPESRNRRPKSESSKKKTQASKKRRRSSGKETPSRSEDIYAESEETPAKRRMSERPVRVRKKRVLPDV